MGCMWSPANCDYASSGLLRNGTPAHELRGGHERVALAALQVMTVSASDNVYKYMPKLDDSPFAINSTKLGRQKAEMTI